MIKPGNRPGPLARTMSSLFGLAPGGVYHATPIAGRAVGSYPTLSPLPVDIFHSPSEIQKPIWAVYFLLHFPWGRPRRALPGTVFPWSPDFPPRTIFRHCAERPSGQLAKDT